MGAHTNVEQISSRFHLSATAALVGVNAVLAWLVATGAVVTSTQWPLGVVAALCLVPGVLVGVATRAIGSGRSAIAGRVAVAVAVGVVVGELAMTLLFSGSIDRRIGEEAAADSPSVAVAAADLDQARAVRTALDVDVDRARSRRDEALVTARCEFNPSPACPQTRITGVPGSGPETRTANELLAGAQQELNAALMARDGRATSLDAAVGAAEHQLGQARLAAVADADRGLGARWVAMNGYTLTHIGALLLRLAVIAVFSLLTLLPLILRVLRDQTSQGLVEKARDEADTAIAIKQAEVRTAAETLWAEQQLINTRFAVAAQNEIDLDHHRRRVADATGIPVPPGRIDRVEDDMYLPIAAEAQAASHVTAELPSGTSDLPAEVAPAERRAPLIPSIPDVTKAAARFVRPLVPPVVARVIDAAAQPVRTARQAFEEVEEITFYFKRVHKVTVASEEGASAPTVTVQAQQRISPHRVDTAFDRDLSATESGVGSRARLDRAGDRPPSAPGHSRALAEGSHRELQTRQGPFELPPSE